jgi:serine/threonine-protein kinase
MTPLQPGDTLDQYRIESLVAEGGMASVFRAIDIQTGAAVALKVPHPHVECDPVLFDRFQREAAIGREVQHPAIPPVVSPKRGARVCFAAEWVEGETLRKLLDRSGPLPRDRAVSIALDLCDVLTCIHRHGIAHRDLKPENIILCPDGTLRLIDFGLASRKGERRLTFGKFSRLMGTADYISPEQLKGARGNARSDLYALGAILFEMLTGQPPFDGDNAIAAMNQRLAAGPPLHLVSPEFRAVLACALRRDPAHRYADAEQLADDLRHPARATQAERHLHSGASPSRGVLVSLALLPAALFLLLLFVAARQ